jgi:NAD-dependent dihydropyrimidine dehydrogenase PreA subunit
MKSRAKLYFLVDVALLLMGLCAFASGLVLLIWFHMGHGRFAVEALGVSRFTWLELHRASAVVVLVAIALHLRLHWKAFSAKVRQALTTLAAHRKPGADLDLYVACALVLLCGFVAWFLPGSPPLPGPVLVGDMPTVRHRFIDVHHLVGLAALALSLQHVVVRAGRLVKPATLGMAETGPTGASHGGSRRRSLHGPTPRHNCTQFVQVDTGKCKACGSCVAECPHQVLKLVAFFWHRHVKVARASACSGCHHCVTRCEQRAIRPRDDRVPTT